jgi:hypothetical protein
MIVSNIIARERLRVYSGRPRRSLPTAFSLDGGAKHFAIIRLAFYVKFCIICNLCMR